MSVKFGLKVNIDGGGGGRDGFIEVQIFFVPRLIIFKLFARAGHYSTFLSVC